MKKLISALLLMFAISFIATGCKKEAEEVQPEAEAVEAVQEAAPEEAAAA